MKINKDFEELFELLNKNEVSYIVVGGYAFAVHVEPRFTKDLDLFVKSELDNAKKIVKTLEEFGFSSLQLSVDDFLEPDQVIQIGNPPYRVDFLTSISGVTFQEVWNHKVKGNYGEQIVNFIGKEEFRKNKRATGRKSDLEDLDKLD
ncbi:MAG: nucleotidyltransferase [Balneolaceae bacterium]|nr:nucleotidyltransferase [Balneolaceae bacterium]MDR9407991.1 nucleotidyltransferase [Balneolaceae bacterium]